MTDTIKIIVNVFDDAQPDLDMIIRKINKDERLEAIGYLNPANFKDIIDDSTKIVITDINAPGFEVFDLIKHIKEDFPGIYIIVASGYFDIGILRKFIRERVWDTVDKNNSDWIKELKIIIDDLVPKIQLKHEALSE